MVWNTLVGLVIIIGKWLMTDWVKKDHWVNPFEWPAEYRETYERHKGIFSELSTEKQLQYLFEMLWQQGIEISEEVEMLSKAIGGPDGH